MTVENFSLDNENQSVSWLYDGKLVEKNFKDMHFASPSTQKKFVYVEAGKNFSQDQIYHLSFDGKLIFAFDKINSKVSWQHQGKLVEVDSKNITNAQLYMNQGIMILITVLNQDDKRLQGFSLDGTLLFVKAPPQGYNFMYLSALNNQPSVVCDGGKASTDAYGRSSWHFSIDTKTGNMTRENLAY